MRRGPLRQRVRGRIVKAPAAQPVDLAGKAVVVTGAGTNSLGYATAKAFASWGADVTVTTRADPADVVAALRAETSAEGGSVHGHALDLCVPESVASFGEWYRSRFGDRLDVLVNNAGIHGDLRSGWKEPRLTDDGFEVHWRTNYLGTCHLTLVLMPLLRASADGSGDARIVNVVSKLHKRGSNAALFEAPPTYNSWNAYGTSKLALMHATFETQRRLAGVGVHAYCTHPGEVATNIADKGLEGHRVINALRTALAPVERFVLMSPDEGAQTQLHCATVPGLEGGRYFRHCAPANPSPNALDADVSARLWAETGDWLASVTAL